MTRIAPQALTTSPVAAVDALRLGVALFGLGGLGVEVVDRLNNRFHGRPEGIGLHPTYVDSVRADGYASPSGPFGLSFSAAEPRFLASDADYGGVLEQIAAGDPPDWAPPVTPAEARSILSAKLPRMIGFGGQPVSSYVAARLGWPGWEPRVEAGLRAAATADPAAEPLAVVVASLYGGTGIGHLPVFLHELQDRGHENVAVFVALPSQARGLLQPAQVADANARGIAVLRGLLRPRRYKHLFLVGSGNRALSRDPRGAAVEVIASTIGAWLENPASFRAEQATWLGQDLQGAATAERISALGAAEVVFPGDTLARQESCEHAARAWQLVTEISAVELGRATVEGERFAWSDPLTRALEEVTHAPTGSSAVAVFGDDLVVQGQARRVLGWFSAGLPDTEPIEPDGSRACLDGQPRRVRSTDLIRLASSVFRADSAYVVGAVRKARALHLAAFTSTVRDSLLEQLGGSRGIGLGEHPWALRRSTEFAGAAALRLESTATRIRWDLARAHEETEPLRRAREALERAEADLPAQVRTRGRFASQQGIAYLDAVDALFHVEALDLGLSALADHLSALAAVCREQVGPLEELVSELDAHRQACAAAAGGFDRHLRHLRAQPTLVVVPGPEPARAAIAAELARSAAGDVTPDLAVALLSRLRLRLDHGRLGPGRPVLEMPAVEGFTTAAEIRRTAASAVTGALSSDGVTSAVAASYLPALAHSLLEPQYVTCTLADALAVEFAHGWAEGQGGHADQEVVARFLDDRVLSPLLRAAASTVETAGSAGPVQPVTRRTVHLDRRTPRGLGCVAAGTAELVADGIERLLAETGVRATGGAPGRATMTTVVNRVPWHRIVELGGRTLADYRGVTRLPVHVDAAVRRAHELESRACELGHLDGRVLDPDVVLMLDDVAALRGFLALVATGRMPTDDADLLGTTAGTYRVDVAPEGRVRTPDWRVLGPVDDPLGALVELFGHPDSRRLRRAVVATWTQEQAKLLVDCNGDAHRARDMVHLALGEMRLPAGRASEHVAADVTLLARLAII